MCSVVKIKWQSRRRQYKTKRVLLSRPWWEHGVQVVQVKVIYLIDVLWVSGWDTFYAGGENRIRESGGNRDATSGPGGYVSSLNPKIWLNLPHITTKIDRYELYFANKWSYHWPSGQSWLNQCDKWFDESKLCCSCTDTYGGRENWFSSFKWWERAPKLNCDHFSLIFTLCCNNENYKNRLVLTWVFHQVQGLF